MQLVVKRSGSAGTAKRIQSAAHLPVLLGMINQKSGTTCSRSRELNKNAPPPTRSGHRVAPHCLPGAPTAMQVHAGSMHVHARSMHVNATFSAKMAPRALKMPPRRSKSPQRALKERSRCDHDASRAFKMVSGCFQSSKVPPGVPSGPEQP